MEQTNRVQSTDAHPIRKNAFISLLISGIGYLYPILIFVYIARILHPEGLGSTAFASSIASIFALFTGLGMPIYGIRSVAEKKQSLQELSNLTAELLIVRIVSGVLAWCAFLAIVWPIAGGESDWPLLMIYGFSILIAILDCSWLYKGMENYSSLAWIFAAVRLFGVVVLFLLVRDASDIRTYAWISILIPMGESIAELIYAQRKWKLGIFRQIKEIICSGKIISAVRKHIRPLSCFLLMHYAVTVYTHTDTVMLGLMKNERAVGLYSCAAKIKGILPVLTETISTVALPRATELWKSRRVSEFRTLSGKAFHVVYMVLLPLTVYFCIFTEPWIVLFGGAEYLEAAWTMRILLLAVIPIGLSNIAGGQMLIPMGHEKELFLTEAVAAVANIFLNAMLIPRFSTFGAAGATVISEIIVLIIMVHYLLKQVKTKIIIPKYLVHSLIGCIIAGTASYGMTYLIPKSIKGPVSFVAFCVLFGTIMLFVRDDLYHSIYTVVKNVYHRTCPAFLRKYLGRTKLLIKSAGYKLVSMLFPWKTKLFCPCCGTKFLSFVSGNYQEQPECYDIRRYQHTKQDVICPVCKSLPRHRILASWCEENKQVLQTAKVLYFAPETSMMLWMKRNKIHYTTADLYEEADLKLDIQAIDLPDQSYGIIVCNHVLEHVNDFRKALSELFRILWPGGNLVCSFPMDSRIDLVDEEIEDLSEEERKKRFGQVDHLRVFGMNASQLLKEAGFVANKITGEAYPEEIVPVVGPADYDMNCLFLCKKP